MKYSSKRDTVTSKMMRYGGKQMEIIAISSGKYLLKGDLDKWCWTDEMFEEKDNLFTLRMVLETKER